MSISQSVFYFELKIHPKYLVSKTQSHIGNRNCNLKDQGIFNRMCVTEIRNVNLQCNKVTSAQSDHIANLKIKADCINLEIGKICRGIFTHVIWKPKHVVKIKNQIPVIVFIDFEPHYKINEVQVEINQWSQKLFRKIN